MGLISLEHGKTAYFADFLLYALSVTALAAWLLFAVPLEASVSVAVCVGLGLVAWTAVEYGVHRFVLHGLSPFKLWHADHHLRPAALLGAPTLLSAGLLGLLLTPFWLWSAPSYAAGMSLGLLTGYLGYALTHHAIHHRRARASGWLRRRKVWHALHHQDRGPAFYGVTSGFWDRALGSVRADVSPAPSPKAAAPAQAHAASRPDRLHPAAHASSSAVEEQL